MTPEDLAKLHIPTDPRVAPDGARVAFVVSTPNVQDDRYDRRIWMAEEGGTRQFTKGPSDTGPKWSPDGSRLAFLRGDGESRQIAVIPTGGGEARVITDFELGVEAVEWAPDGHSLIAVAVTYTDEWSGLDDEERARRPRRVQTVPYQFDDKGWIHDRRRHLWLVDPGEEQELRCLTPGDFDEELPAWSPDGSKVAFITDRDPARGLATGNDVFEVEIETGETTRVAPRGSWTFVSYSPKGAIHVLGNTKPGYPFNSYLYRLDDNGTLLDLTTRLDRSSVSLTGGPPFIGWDDDRAVIGLEDSGTLGLVSVAADGSTRIVVEGPRLVNGFDFAAGRIVFTASSIRSPGELFSLENETESQVSDLNSHELGFVEPEHFRVESSGTDVDVWVYLPEGEEKVPLLLNIHGGPASQYGFGFFDEFQVYAGAGYGVVACNPRGSSGRGEEFLNSVRGESWGRVDLDDVRQAVSSSLDMFPRLDADRMGVMGGSYGGFLTAWIIGHEDRWRSAVVERALISWTSFAGTSDIGGVFPENYLLAPYPEAWDTWWRMSPLALAENVRTPTLILHAENDFRCPIEQAEQYFMALLRNGTPAELVRFPGEGHELSRSGKPRHRVERFEAILEWHDRYLR